jgi:hypothetical protein
MKLRSRGAHVKTCSTRNPEREKERKGVEANLFANLLFGE